MRWQPTSQSHYWRSLVGCNVESFVEKGEFGRALVDLNHMDSYKFYSNFLLEMFSWLAIILKGKSICQNWKLF